MTTIKLDFPDIEAIAVGLGWKQSYKMPFGGTRQETRTHEEYVTDYLLGFVRNSCVEASKKTIRDAAIQLIQVQVDAVEDKAEYQFISIKEKLK